VSAVLKQRFQWGAPLVLPTPKITPHDTVRHRHSGLPSRLVVTAQRSSDKTSFDASQIIIQKPDGWAFTRSNFYPYGAPSVSLVMSNGSMGTNLMAVADFSGSRGNPWLKDR
jgi:hypothetical protein